MRGDLLDILRCPRCKTSNFQLQKGVEGKLELLNGYVLCSDCKACYEIKDGIVNFLKSPSPFILRERQAMDEECYIRDEKGNRYRINAETIERFKNKFLSLPKGDGSSFFKRGGSFQSIRDASGRFYRTLDELSLKGGERVLELGSGFSWASYRFAKRGCNVVAMDISNYLKASRLYVNEIYFDRVFSDMHNMPFSDNTFDIVFGAAVLHHSKDIKSVFSEIRRVLRHGAKVILINESARGVFEKEHPDLKELEKKGFSDTSYTIPEWKHNALKAGFKKINMDFLSLADDYIVRHSERQRDNFKLRFAYFLKRHRRFENFLLFLLTLPRILFRPKSWRMVCWK